MDLDKKYNSLSKKIILLFVIVIFWFIISLLAAVFISRSVSVCKFCGSLLAIYLWAIGFAGFQPSIWISDVRLQMRIRLGLQSSLLGIIIYLAIEAFCADAFNIGIFAFEARSTWWTFLIAQIFSISIAIRILKSHKIKTNEIVENI